MIVVQLAVAGGLGFLSWTFILASNQRVAFGEPDSRDSEVLGRRLYHVPMLHVGAPPSATFDGL